MSMQKITHYVSWQTWKSDTTHTPWDFWYLKHGVRYKLKSDHTKELDLQTLEDAFLNQNTEILDKIERDYINSVWLMAFVEADSPQTAQEQILHLFPDAEFDRVQTVDTVQKQNILKLLQHLQQPES
jgi:hypothetical protein